jgi:hypothetical protein
MIGNVCLVFGMAGLAFTFILAGLVATGATEPPSPFTALGVPVQSVVNLAAGWNLRRQAAS